MPDTDVLGNIRVVLCETSHPGNIGAAARAMKTMGLSALHLVRPQRFPDPQANWRATNAADLVDAARVHDTLDGALAGVTFAVACSARSRDVAVPAIGAREAAKRLIAIARTHPVALVFGNEQAGLTTEAVNKCKLLASIPTNAKFSSLNLGAAVQVFAYELRMSLLDAPQIEPVRERATHEEVEGFYGHLEQVMTDVGFLDARHPKKLMPRLRRLFARVDLEPEEIHILRGILKAIAFPKKR